MITIIQPSQIHHFKKKPKTNSFFEKIPYELLSLMTNYISSSKTIFSLMLTCRDLYENSFYRSDIYVGCEYVMFAMKKKNVWENGKRLVIPYVKGVMFDEKDRLVRNKGKGKSRGEMEMVNVFEEMIEKCPNWKRVDFGERDERIGIDKRVLKIIKKRKFEEVRIEGKCISNEKMKYFEGVKRLDIGCCNVGYGYGYGNMINDKSMIYLKGIHTLNISGCEVTDNGLKYIKGIHTLTINDNILITNNGLEYLIGIKKLSISRCSGISDDGLVYLQGSIHTLNIRFNTKIANKGLRFLKGINTLNLSYCNLINDKGMEFLKGIYSLNISGLGQIGDEGLKYLSGIRYLIFGYNNKITDKGLKFLKGIYHLVIRYNNKITDNGIKYLQGIRSLDISECKNITDLGLKWLVGINSLVIRYNNNITEEGIKCLEPRIENLDTSYCRNIKKK